MQQLSNTKIFHSQIFSKIKWITLSGKFCKIKYLVALEETGITNAFSGLYILLTTILQEW